ncbi:GpE family phage tail protein [Neomegalonema sp.]|nr:GpE family phage tail protein [Neomegalonema sp.]MDD2870081.1 GpE family phage tail protein [Neomegalonema sp.]
MISVTGWAASEIDGMEISDLNDWLEEAILHAKATRAAREGASS